MPKCYVCGAEATCCGEYEGATTPQFCCDDHCGHGNEDGWCCGIEAAVARLAEQRNAALEQIRHILRTGGPT